MTKQKSPTIGDVDLFGAPVGQIRERWGRGSFAKNEENQLLVASLKAAGWSQTRIANYLKCDEKTLRKHFSRELAAGADLLEGQAIEVTIAKMRQGYAWATREVREMCKAGAAAVPIAPGAGDTPSKLPELGKKEQLELEAKKPAGGWGSRLN